MFRNCKKEDLVSLLSEIAEIPTAGLSIIQLKNEIEGSKIFTEDPEFVKGTLDIIVKDRKIKEDNESKIRETQLELEKQKIEFERIKLQRLEKELELEKLREQKRDLNDSNNKDVSNLNLENIIKSIKTLTIPVPKNVECFNLFFNSLEKAFKTKGVNDEFKAEILLNILGDRIGNLMVYLKEDELCDYEKIKTIVLKEFQPTPPPHACLNHFKRAQKLANESYVQFASRLSATFEYYCQLREVKDFRSLCELIISDKIIESLDRELTTHIGIKQGETWYKPQELGRECDIFISSKGKMKGEQNLSLKYKSKFETQRYDTNNQNNNFRGSKNNSNVYLSSIKNVKCVTCKTKEFHPLYLCPVFKSLSVNERVEIVKANYLCYKCLSADCNIKKCRAKNCFCGKPHNRLLHFTRELDRSPNNINETRATTSPKSVLNVESSPFYPNFSVTNENVQSSFSATSTIENKLKRTVLLSTAKLYIRDKYGNFQVVRGLLDAGSQSDILTKEYANRLELKQEKINVTVSCLNNSSMTVTKFVKAEISNLDRSFNQEFEFLVVDKIADLTPGKYLSVEGQIPFNINLADNFMVPQKIDCLLGAKWFYHLLRPEKIYTPHSELFFQNSVFGFLASGSVPELDSQKIHCGLIIDDDLNSTMRKFWELENVELEIPKSHEAKLAEEHFVRTHFRKPSGKYVVTIPLKEEPDCLGESRTIALK